MITNTWFQTRQNARYTLDGKMKKQIHYILVDKRYRNSGRNCKTRLDADCRSDHNLVIARMNIKLQRNTKIKKGKETRRQNTDVLKEETV